MPRAHERSTGQQVRWQSLILSGDGGVRPALENVIVNLGFALWPQVLHDMSRAALRFHRPSLVVAETAGVEERQLYRVVEAVHEDPLLAGTVAVAVQQQRDPTQHLALLSHGFDMVGNLRELDLFRAKLGVLLGRLDGAPTPVLRFGAFLLDRTRRLVRVGVSEIRLSPALFAVVEILAMRSPRALSAEQIQRVLARDGRKMVSQDAIKMRVARLRSVLPPHGSLIETSSGGYRLSI